MKTQHIYIYRKYTNCGGTYHQTIIAIQDKFWVVVSFHDMSEDISYNSGSSGPGIPSSILQSVTCRSGA